MIIRIVTLSIISAFFANGEITVDDMSREAFTRPLPNLLGERRTPFFVGNSFFNQNWVAAPASTAARDGLGPLFNTRSCSTCHFKDGRGPAPAEDQPFRTTILRISRPGQMPDPIYGSQIQGSALPGVRPEADVRVAYEVITGTFADGETYALRRPRYRLENPSYGPGSHDLLMSARVAPAVIGLGLLERISLGNADPEDKDNDGISGRINIVQNGAIGRFGWKAEQATVASQVAAAFQGDMGLTTSVRPDENHTTMQDPHLESGGSPEVSDQILDSVAYYCRSLAVPVARKSSLRGRQLFTELRCAACHTPEHTTGSSSDFPELSHQQIQPYTDLLLHDMGDELGDQRPVHSASGNEWRTPPLWGIGLIPKVNGHSFLLHDGRARNVNEAILWHGGEAHASREAFRALPKADRQELIEFIQSL